MNRKINILPLMTLLCTLPFAKISAQQKNPTTTTASQADINSIRSEFKRINGLTLRNEKFTYEAAACAEDGVVQYFFNGKEIVKIIETGAIGDGSWTKEYYYQSGKFIFSYEVAIGSSADGQDSKIEHRLYVKDGKILRYMEDQKEIKADSEAERGVRVADKIRNAYTTKEFAKALCE
ncbi:hypothetical protein [Chitinophaga pinensis]|uniref:Lipoprotein n=1 Tax=Chitinophaga pinensis TaxID=79329 RepID=A0A5C6LK40_9BACT|nr:hypothetical protein [Chitinophaga pinensis]TWV94013.1 hypothetical protein FEF09_26110 [Chitinophaga pinensis]